MLLSDNSITACAIKTIWWISRQEEECAHLELAALKAALGKRNLVQTLGAVECANTAGEHALVIVTE